MSKIVILLLTGVLLAVGAYGCTQLETHFDITSFYKKGSTLERFLQSEEKWFKGVRARLRYQHIYIGPEDLYRNQHVLADISHKVKGLASVDAEETECWYDDYSSWLGEVENATTQTTTCNTTLIRGKRVQSQEKLFYLCLLWFKKKITEKTVHQESIVFNVDKTGILASSVCAVRLNRNEVDAVSKATHAIQEIVVDARKKGLPTAFQHLHSLDSPWYGLQIISSSVFTNTVLAISVIFLCCLLLTANLWISLLIGSCVILSTVDVAGVLYFWGVKIDGIFTLCMIIGVGLIVDYAVHIGHSFIHVQGTKSERVQQVLLKVGPAVWHGGFSTFIAFSVLILAKSGIIITFFKIFFLVVIFGMFHGLVYLPVILSLVGGDTQPDTAVSKSEQKRKDLNIIFSISNNTDKFENSSDNEKSGEVIEKSVDLCYANPVEDILAQRITEGRSYRRQSSYPIPIWLHNSRSGRVYPIERPPALGYYEESSIASTIDPTPPTTVTVPYFEDRLSFNSYNPNPNTNPAASDRSTIIANSVVADTDTTFSNYTFFLPRVRL